MHTCFTVFPSTLKQSVWHSSLTLLIILFIPLCLWQLQSIKSFFIMKRKLFLLLFVLTCTIAVFAQQAVYNYYPRIVMGSTVEQVKQKMKGLSSYRFEKETNIPDLHFITYVKSDGKQVNLHFNSKGKLTFMDGIDVSYTEFENALNQIINELKAAGKDSEGVACKDNITGSVNKLFDLSGTNVAKFTLIPKMFSNGYICSISVIDKEMKEFIIKDAK